MPRENYVEVELIVNPSVKRTMNINSFRMNQKKWRLQSQSFETTPVVKKKDVEPVVEPFPPFPPFNVDVGKVEEAVSTIEKRMQQTTIDTLRDQYLAKTGNKPDGRWNISRLTKEING